MNKKILLVCALFSSIAFSMDQIESEKIFSKKEIVLCLAAPYILDHKASCCFADTSKYCKNLILQTVSKRKDALKIPSLAKDRFGLFFHKYGSSAWYIYPTQDALYFRSFHLNQGRSCIGGKTFSGFLSPISSHRTPFLNEKGNFCLYGYGLHEVKDPENGICRKKVGILHYCMDGDKKVCIMQTSKGRVYDLSLFLSYPFLLKAFLDSKPIIKSVKPEGYTTSAQIYSFSNVIIPENYKERMQFIPERNDWEKDAIFHNACLSIVFEDFMEDLREEIENRYQACSGRVISK